MLSSYERYERTYLEVDYDDSTNLGHGTSSIVYKGTLADFPDPVAVKMFDLDRIDVSICQHETAIMFKLKELNLPNVIMMHAYCCTQYQYALCLELAEKGAVSNRMLYYLNEKEREKIMIDVANAVIHLHQHNILHCDIKPNNILVMKNDEAKLADFGYSLQIGIDKVRKRGGADFFAAPENYLQKSDYTFSSDIFSLGVTYYCIERRNIDPYPDCSYFSIDPFLKKTVCVGQRNKIPVHWPAHIKLSITNAWAHRPEDRPTAVELKEMLECSGNKLGVK